MAASDRFTRNEWAALAALPGLAATAAALADGGNPIGALKEARVGMRTIDAAGKQYAEIEMIQEILAEHAVEPGERADPTAIYAGNIHDPAKAAPMALETAMIANAALAKATPEEAAAYRQWVEWIARSVAKASTTGGFAGFGGVKVNAEEAKFLSDLIATLGRA